MTTGDDQFDAMVATLPEPVTKLPGTDDLYCGHKDRRGLSWTRTHCPICNPHLACPVCGGTGEVP